MNKWKRSLGTSKKEQGVITPKRPADPQRAYKVKMGTLKSMETKKKYT